MDKTLAIIWLRYRLAVNRLRTFAAIGDLISLVAIWTLGGIFSLGLAVGLGLATHKIVAANEETPLTVLFNVAFLIFLVMAILIPIARGFLNPGLEVSRFLMFPISYRKLYAVTLGSSSVGSDHLLYYPGLLAMCLAGALPAGRDGLVGLGIVLLLVASYVIWGHTIALLAQVVLKLRGVKVAATIIALVAWVTGILYFLVVHDPVEITAEDRNLLEAIPTLGQAFAVYRLLPPGRAAAGLVALHLGELRAVVPAIAGLLLWVFAGVGLGYFIFSRYHLGERGKARGPAAAAPAAPLPAAGRWFPQLGVLRLFQDQTLAVAGKDLRYLMRSASGKLTTILGPVISVVVGILLREKLAGPVWGMAPDNLVLFGVIFYLTVMSGNFVYNAYAWEGTGIDAYFLHPVPLRRIIAGKNLAVLLHNLVLFCVCVLIWSFFVRFPDVLTLVTCLIFFGNVFLMFIMVGNFVSIAFPVARDIASQKSQPSETGMLFSFLSMIGIGLVLALTMAIPAFAGFLYLQPVFLAGLLGVVLLLYFRLLHLAARLLEERREVVMETLRAKGASS